MTFFRLVPERSFTDRALSASKGHHRKRGKLRDIIDAVRRGEFLDNPTVLVMEAMDRLFREGASDVFSILGEFVRGGLIIVFGGTEVWCRVRLDTDDNHAILAEINGAKRYTDRIREFAKGAHKRRREKFAKLANDPAAPRPVLNGRVPGWLLRKNPGDPDTDADRGFAYKLDPANAPTVVRIFEMAASGMTSVQIADALNRDGVPLMRWMEHAGQREWRKARVGALLADRRVLGLYTPAVRDEGDRRVVAGAEVQAYPAVIPAALWQRARDILEGRRTLTGRKGTSVPNLFSKKVFCRTCGAPMRVDTGGRPADRRDRRTQRTLVCSRWTESKACPDRTRYDLWHFEPLILDALLTLLQLAPRRTSHTGRLAEDHAALLVAIAGLEASMAALAPVAATSPAILAQVTGLGRQVDAHRREAADLRIRLDAETNTGTAAADAWAFLRASVQTAASGDVGARERLRSLLARFEFRIAGTSEGGLAVTAEGRTREIPPEVLPQAALPIPETWDEAWEGDQDAIDAA